MIPLWEFTALVNQGGPYRSGELAALPQVISSFV